MTLEEAVRLIAESLEISLAIDQKSQENQAYLGSIHGHFIFGPQDKISVIALLNALSIESTDSQFINSKVWFSALESNATQLPPEPKLTNAFRLLALTPVPIEQVKLVLDILSMQFAATALFYEKDMLLTVVPEDEQLADGVLALSETLLFEMNGSANILLSQLLSEQKQIVLAYQSLHLMNDAIQQGIIKAPAIFDQVTTALLLSEWLAKEHGPVAQSILKYSPLQNIDEEVEKTADMLFKMNLNLTDTAKALFIHRNTLIYRLDKIHKQYGLDLRLFEDAFQLKLLLALIKQNANKN